MHTVLESAFFSLSNTLGMFLHVMRSFAIFIDCRITLLIAYSDNSMKEEFKEGKIELLQGSTL